MRGLAIAAYIMMAACDAGEPPAPPTAPLSLVVQPAPPDPHGAAVSLARAPFAIFNTLVDEHGKVVHTFPQLSRYAVAVPRNFDIYEVAGSEVNARTGEVHPLQPAVEFRPRNLGSPRDNFTLVRHERDGSVRWTVPVTFVGGPGPWDVAVEANRVVVSSGGDLVAYDDRSGREVWRAKGELGQALQARGDLAYYLTCDSERSNYVVARALVDGAVRFRVPIAASCSPGLHVGFAHLEVVKDRHTSTDVGVYDLAGHQLYRMPDFVRGPARADLQGNSLVEYNGDDIAISDRRIARLDNTGYAQWTLGPPKHSFVADNAVVHLEEGDEIIANYGTIDDSGVDVMRIDPDTGKLVWRTQVPGLGVAHSEYEQTVYVVRRGPSLFVISQASGGAFLERLSVATGARELRCIEPDGRCVPVPRD